MLMSKKVTVKSVRELFTARTTAFEKATSEILQNMQAVQEAIHEYMCIDEIEKRNGSLIWEEASLVGTGKDSLIILIGVVSFPAGSVLDLGDGKSIKVTKDTEPYFRKIIRAGIPLSVAVKTKKQILKYLEKTEEEERKDQEETLDKLFQSEVEFDLSQLTDEQRKAYETSTIVTTHKNAQ